MHLGAQFCSQLHVTAVQGLCLGVCWDAYRRWCGKDWRCGGHGLRRAVLKAHGEKHSLAHIVQSDTQRSSVEMLCPVSFPFIYLFIYFFFEMDFQAGQLTSGLK